jgi:hypothetical protein
MLDLHHDHDNLEGVWALKLARLKKMLTCGGGPSKYREKPLLHLKDTRRWGGTNQAKLQNCAPSSWLFHNVQFVASVNI